MTKNNTAVKKTGSQSVVYKVPAAFALMILVILGFWKLASYYSTLGGFEALYGVFGTLGIVFYVLLAGCLVAQFVCRPHLAKTLLRYGAAASALLAVSFTILRTFWTGNMIAIYLLHALVYCLYMVWQLYRSEFFTFSLATASAGVVFYLIAHTAYRANRIIGSIALALVLLAIAFVTFRCSRSRGELQLFGRTLRVFPASFNPLLFYFTCVLWAVVLVACLIFGAGVAYYAMFAAIAVELIGAVYYTFQLK